MSSNEVKYVIMYSKIIKQKKIIYFNFYYDVIFTMMSSNEFKCVIMYNKIIKLYVDRKDLVDV